MADNSKKLLTYCGLYCGACPSYHRGTCFGCRSKDKSQKRTSKWGCKIRQCCINEKEGLHCGECSEFPCSKISNKLIDSHSDDSRFTYRHEIPDNIKEINRLGYNKWIKREENRWTCDECGAAITFYDYKCVKCNKEYKADEIKLEGQ
jgi:hypothetical protein